MSGMGRIAPRLTDSIVKQLITNVQNYPQLFWFCCKPFWMTETKCWITLREVSSSWRFPMTFDTDRIDDAILALLYLGLHDRYRAWKSFEWEAMNRLHEKGMIDNPKNKNKSVVFTEEGLSRSRTLFEAMFTRRAG
jgi:hypothetical protein